MCKDKKNTKNDYNKIISGALQGSILEPILFNLSIKDFFFFIEIASMHYYADDNAL